MPSPLDRTARSPPPLAIRACACLEQRVPKDLWLSATGAVLNGGWRPRRRKCEAGNIVPSQPCKTRKIAEKAKGYGWSASCGLCSVFSRTLLADSLFIREDSLWLTLPNQIRRRK